MNGMWKKLKSVKLAILSRIEYKKEITPLQKSRLSVCKSCPHNSDNKKNLNTEEKIMLSLNKFLNFIMRVDVTDNSMCTLCGCQLIHKSTQTDEDNKCPLKKWK